MNQKIFKLNATLRLSSTGSSKPKKTDPGLVVHEPEKQQEEFRGEQTASGQLNEIETTLEHCGRANPRNSKVPA